jgi:uncharacterized lipoprotein
MSNQILIANRNEEVVWEQVVDVLHDYLFPIARENRMAHYIETDYKVGASVLEPWHKDSVGADNRWESTLQSMRRKVIARVIPTENGQGFFVSIEAFKEIEDINGLVANSPGGATLSENRPLDRDMNQVVGQTRPSVWIPKGRDLALENALLAEISHQVPTISR